MHKSHHQHTFLGSDHRAARYVAQPLTRFLSIEAAGGALLVIAAAVALVWANSPWSASYTSLFGTEVTIHIGSFELHGTIQHWINDALMAVFFFVAGLEIKRELVRGELRDPKAAALPIIGALGGMLVPALIFVAFNAGTEASRGFGIPVATDIAFAVGVVSLLGKRVPGGLKLFLLALAIADDLGGIIVIAIFYASGIKWVWLLAAAAGLVVVYLMRRVKVWYLPAYVLVGLGVWLAMYESGVHATIAGVALGLLAPTFPLREDLDAEAIADTLENRDELTAADVQSAAFLIQETVPIGDRLSEALHPWSSYVILPLFALANLLPLGLMFLEGSNEWALEKMQMKAPSAYMKKHGNREPIYHTFKKFIYDIEEAKPGITRLVYRAAERGGPNAVIRLLDNPEINGIVQKYAAALGPKMTSLN